MKRTLPWLATPYAPVSFFVVATFLPYLVANNNVIFSINPILSPIEHTLVSLPLLLLLFCAAHLGYQHKPRSRGGLRLQHRRTTEPQNNTRLLTQYAPWSLRIARTLLWTCVVSSIAVGLYTFAAYRTGSFLTARAALDFQGVGVVLRLYIAGLPLYLALVGRFNREATYAVILLGFSVFLRAIAISERSALIEFALVFSVCYHFVTRISLLKYALYSAPVVLVYMALSLRDRLTTQGFRLSNGLFDSITFEMNNALIYYADTINKLYIGIFQGLTSSSLYIADPVYKLLGAGTVTDVGLATKYFLRELHSLGITDPGLSNPGGLAQDFSDFWYFFLPVVIAKFYIFGRLGRLFDNGHRIGLCLYPICFVAIFEYARFNYFYNGYGFLLGATFVMIAALIRPRRGTLGSLLRRPISRLRPSTLPPQLASSWRPGPTPTRDA
ncbi:MAG: hypothetical protein HZA66_03435 [Rhodopseudomonas palustris]|uniref:Oligosaccharide repeat unit polymerase n=1 Tax=Rhodopseudomonas palustris TaxID=1076 RepID=A0A933RUF4_RHOPL|nr:hypothetical protein [Rhodopseudomonas palustris]